MKTLLKAALCAVYKGSGAARLQEAIARRTGRSCGTILLFHRVTDDIPEDGLTIGTARFRRICGLLRRGFRVVPLAEMFHVARAGGPVPPRAVAVTFDDCYRDNLAAAEVLAEHGLPATFFVPAAFVGAGHTFPWDRHLRRLAHLSWDDVRSLARQGFEIGSHTLTHANLAAVSWDEARRELVESKRVIEDQVGRRVRWLAYPFGGREHFRAELLPLVTEAGYEGCLSGFGGFVRRGHGSLLLPRQPAPGFRSLLNLELHLRGCLGWLYHLKGKREWSDQTAAPAPGPMAAVPS
jgi:peptidoglycan/xylan/chitin deacetylase (PgdA/CDA1 family)